MATPNKADDFRVQLKSLVENLPDKAVITALSQRRLKILKQEVAAAIQILHKFCKDVDRVSQPKVVFDPADPKVIGELIARTLLLQPCQPLKDIKNPEFYGSGVYAIYYTGKFPAYLPISNTANPIYVGKADPSHLHAQTVEEQGKGLHNRLEEHRKSIMAASSTLSIDDFMCRYLVVKSAWQETAENYLIRQFKPVWNKQTKIVQGFGKHGDRAETRANRRASWDTIHPGRKWATVEENVPNTKSAEQILQNIADHFAKFPPIKDLESLSSEIA